MNKYTNKITRLTLIIERLSKGMGLSTPNLVDFFQVSNKQVQTDFKDYILNIFDDDTIYYDYSSKTYLAKTNFLTSTLFTSKELAIISIVKAKTKDKYSDDDLYEKTNMLFLQHEELLKDNIFQHASVEKIDKFKSEIVTIKNAINTKHIVTCNYNDKVRTIYPLKIINIEGFWYLINHDTTDKKIKTFHLQSIKNIDISPKRFTFDDKGIVNKFDNCINAYFKPTAKPITVILYIDKQIVRYFERKPLNSSQRIIKKYNNGNIDLEVIISDFMEIIPTIQKYIPLIKVIEPQELSDKIEENLKNYFKSI
ncbi:MAG: WYL domain-containing protein [Sulfurimonas sp.]|nr:WYL domain-containing protein [Sulfurimonas sp.]